MTFSRYGLAGASSAVRRAGVRSFNWYRETGKRGMWNASQIKDSHCR